MGKDHLAVESGRSIFNYNASEFFLLYIHGYCMTTRKCMVDPELRG